MGLRYLILFCGEGMHNLLRWFALLFFCVFFIRYDGICRLKYQFFIEKKLSLWIREATGVCGQNCVNLMDAQLIYSKEKKALYWQSKKNRQWLMRLDDFYVERVNGVYRLAFDI